MYDKTAEIEARLAGITPGPWLAKKGVGWFITRPEAVARREGAIAVSTSEAGNLVDDPEAPWEIEGRAQANAELMAHAPDDLRHLLDENKRLRKALIEYANMQNWGYYDRSGCAKGHGEQTDACFLGPEVAADALRSAARAALEPNQ